MTFRHVSLALLLAAAGAVTTLSGQASRTTRDGVYSAEQALRGKELYADKCFMCHGRELRGEGEARPLSGDRFLSDWETIPVQTLFDRVRTTMPFKTPGTLSRQQTADLVAFLLYFNGYPAGQAELSTKAEVLQDIQIVLRQR
jgi:mono/diheme cytochrome c family protein